MGIKNLCLNFSITSLKKEKGFTLIEISLAITILVVGILSILALYPLGLVSSKRSEDTFIASNQAQEVMGELQELTDETSLFVSSGTSLFQKKFHSNEYFYLYRIDDISGAAIPGNSYSYPTDLYYVSIAVYTVDKYAGGTSTSPNTPTGKAIKTFRSFLSKDL
ncbi:prepilin-type N-terminal cleavage/methylation domain-containing protein [bacterium]|nr:prepilin-type N-terminal cleavage/methylation domain-containing protein [bacterium]